MKNLKGKYKLKLLILPIITIIVLVSTIYFSYAYFLIGTDTENSVILTAGEFDILYNQGTSLNLASAEPIYDDYKYTRANFIPFEITNTGEKNSKRNIGNGAEASSSCYSAFFDITRLDNSLQSKYLRWELYDVTNSKIVSAGTFGGYQEGDSIFLTGSNTLAYGSSHSFKLYIWLSYSTTVNQIELLGKTISGSVRIESNSLSGCPLIVNVTSFDASKLTITNGHQEVSVGSNVTVGYTLLTQDTYPINLCEMFTTNGTITFENVQMGHNCTMMTSADEYPFVVWARNLAYDNSRTGLKDVNTNDDCEDSQCAIDAIANMVN